MAVKLNKDTKVSLNKSKGVNLSKTPLGHKSNFAKNRFRWWLALLMLLLILLLFSMCDRGTDSLLDPASQTNSLANQQDNQGSAIASSSLANQQDNQGSAIASSSLANQQDNQGSAIASSSSTIIINFSFNSSSIDENQIQNLQEINPNNIKEIKAYCDQRGNKQYNMELAKNRLKSIKKYLKGSYTSTPIGAASFLCLEQTRECFSKNRRVEIVMGK